MIEEMSLFCSKETGCRSLERERQAGRKGDRWSAEKESD